MTALTIIAVVLALASLGFIAWTLSRPKSQDPALGLIQQQMEGLRNQLAEQLSRVNDQLARSQETLGLRLDKAAQVVGEVQRSLGSLDKATSEVLGLGKQMNQELGNLKSVFQPPKMRGGIGEVMLGNLLAEVLPREHFELQYPFKNGEKVDAIIRLPEGLVPVDAKFPLENFQRFMEAKEEKVKSQYRKEFVRDVKKHIQDIAAKYILPDEGTLDFALMYIPAENVYYEIILRDEGGEKELYHYAIEKKVMPVSPNAFYAYLAALVRGFRGMKIAQKAQEIAQHLGRLSGDLRRFGEDFSLVGKHLNDAQKKYGDAEKRLTRLEEKLVSLQEGSPLPLPEKTSQEIPASVSNSIP